MEGYFKHKFVFSVILSIVIYPILIIIGVISHSKESTMRAISIILIIFILVYMIHYLDKAKNEKK